MWWASYLELSDHSAPWAIGRLLETSPSSSSIWLLLSYPEGRLWSRAARVDPGSDVGRDLGGRLCRPRSSIPTREVSSARETSISRADRTGRRAPLASGSRSRPPCSSSSGWFACPAHPGGSPLPLLVGGAADRADHASSGSSRRRRERDLSDTSRPDRPPRHHPDPARLLRRARLEQASPLGSLQPRRRAAGGRSDDASRPPRPRARGSVARGRVLDRRRTRLGRRDGRTTVILPEPGERAVTQVTASGAPVAALVHDPRPARGSRPRAVGRCNRWPRARERAARRRGARAACRGTRLAGTNRRGDRCGAAAPRARSPRRRAAATRRSLAEAPARADPAQTTRIRRRRSPLAQEDLEQALAELREFARGIHPTVLREDGLDAAARVARPPVAGPGRGRRLGRRPARPTHRACRVLLRLRGADEHREARPRRRMRR